MPARRWIYYDGDWWSMRRLAAAYNLPVGTLVARLKRLPVKEALSAQIMTRSQCGLCGKNKSPWGEEKA